MSRPASKKEAVLVALFAVLTAAPWLGKAWHNDEPFFLAAARQVLADPARPMAFTFPWYGRELAADAINTTPPVLFYLTAAALKLSGGSEFGTRLLLLPLDVLAAVSLYFLGGLLPALVVIASPAWTLNMGHVMAEKPAMAFGLFGLWAWLQDDRRWQRAGLAALSLAIFSKYIAVLFLAPAFWKRRDPRLLLTLLPSVLWAADPAAIRRALDVTTESAGGWWANSAHKARSFLAFVGGSLAGALLWARPTRRQALIAFAVALAVFLPFWDMAHVRSVDRWTGILLAFGALCSLTRMPAWLAAWAAAGALLQVFAYWSVMTRIVLFFVPPLVFALKPRHWSAVAVSAALTAALGAVDYRYAAAQKEFARELDGRDAWHSSYMGLAAYIKGRPLSDWDLAKPGDVVAVCGINSALRKPRSPRPALASTRELSHPIPLRLMSGWTGEGGFYSNLSGFLPFSISDEPLETFTVVELQ